jgi:predicted NBD/HSP70 family sugar kinase
MRRPGGKQSGLVVRLARASDIEASSQARLAAERIGDVLAAIVSFANPAAIIINGTLAPLDNAMLAGIRSGVFGQALRPATRRLSIDISELREKAGTIGAVTLVQRNLIADDGLSTLFRLD